MSIFFHMFESTSRVALPNEFKSTEDLLVHLGVSKAEMNKIWWFRSRMYSHFDISKSNGKKRIISAPDRRLKMIQRSIADSLTEIYRPRNPVHGFVLGRSVKSNAMIHLRRRYILNIDLKDFFPSISERRVFGLLHSIGVDKGVAKVIVRICCDQEHLPQGAPSSPIISNMICFRLDKSLMEFAKTHRLLYTRYADDITISSYQPPSSVFQGARPPSGKLDLDNLSDRLRHIISNNGFELNPDKLYYADKNARRTVTGLKTNEGLNVDRRYIRNIRATLFKTETMGAAAVEEELKSRFGKICSLQAHLHGKIAWVGFVKGRSDPVFRGLATRYNACFKSNHIKIQPTRDEIRDRAVWVLEHEDGQGTAFFLNGIGLITASHCVKGATDIEIFHPAKPSNRFCITVAHECKYRDLALLDHKIPKKEYFELAPSNELPNIGSNTVALGFPSYGPGDRLNIKLGTISSNTVKSAVKYIEVTQKLSQGMSGGPLINDTDEVIGVIHKGGPTEQRDFAVDIDVLKEWAKELFGV